MSRGPTRAALTDRIALGMQHVIADGVLFNERLARMIGLNVVDLQTYGVISRSAEPMSPGEVSAATYLPSSTTTRVLDRLEAKELVARTPDPADRRRVLVRALPPPPLMADVGHEYERLLQQMADLHEDFTVDELEVVARYLEAVRTVH